MDESDTRAWDEIGEAIETLAHLRNQHLALAEQIGQAMGMLQAILSAESAIRHPSTAPTLPAFLRRQPPQPRSVYEVIVGIADEGPRDWSPHDFATEIEKRKLPLDVTDLKNSVYSAVSRAHKSGVLLRTAPGRYCSAKFPPAEERPLSEGGLGGLFKGEGEPLE